DHTLALIDWASTKGSFPRDFALDKTNHFLVVANQNTNNATLFKRDPKNGKLKCIQQNIPLPEGICVCFRKSTRRRNLKCLSEKRHIKQFMNLPSILIFKKFNFNMTEQLQTKTSST